MNALSGTAAAVAMPGTATEQKTRNRGEWLIFAPLLATTLFSKLSLPPLGERGLGIGFPLVFLALAVGIARERIGFDAGRVCFCALMVFFLGILQFFQETSFSMLSFVYLVVVGLCYTLRMSHQPDPAAVAERLVNVVLFFALCGIAQFALQYVVPTQFAFPIETLVPRQFVIQGFNYLNPLYDGIYKANGIFLLEPSFFSQLLAIGIIAEVVTRQRVWCLALLALATILSYSGTGLIVLGIGLPVAIAAKKRTDLIALLVAVIVLCLIFAAPLRLDLIVDRVGEFSSPGSSASARFVGWFYLFRDTLFDDVNRALIGYGAGNFKDVAVRGAYPVAEMMHAKIFIEYGLPGGILYLGFLFFCIFSSSAHVALKFAVIALHFMAGAYSESITGIALTFLLLMPAGATLRTASKAGRPSATPVPSAAEPQRQPSTDRS
jgi:hypothetical protein